MTKSNLGFRFLYKWFVGIGLCSWGVWGGGFDIRFEIAWKVTISWGGQVGGVELARPRIWSCGKSALTTPLAHPIAALGLCCHNW
jgi:hypothetical protein